MEKQQGSIALNEESENLTTIDGKGIDDIADDIAESMPPVTDHQGGSSSQIPDFLFPDGEPGAAAQEDPQPQYFDPANPPADYNPVIYNPKYHQEDPDNPGQGIRNQNGTFRKKGGRPRKQQISKPAADQAAPGQVVSEVKLSQDPGGSSSFQDQDFMSNQGGAAQADPAGEIPGDPGGEIPLDPEAVLVGKTAANMFFMIGQAIGGSEWTPSGEERELLEDAWIQYMRSKGIVDIPPGINLALLTGMFITPRLSKPKTKSRIRMAWNATKAKFKKFNIWRKYGNAHTDFRDDNVREKHSSQAADQDLSEERDR